LRAIVRLEPEQSWTIEARAQRQDNEPDGVGLGNNPCNYFSINRAEHAFTGCIDELHFYDRALSDAEVAALVR
jgi:hypothetical protein